MALYASSNQTNFIPQLHVGNLTADNINIINFTNLTITNDLTVGHDANIGHNLNVSNNVAVSGSITATGDLITDGTLFVNNNIIGLNNMEISRVVLSRTAVFGDIPTSETPSPFFPLTVKEIINGFDENLISFQDATNVERANIRLGNSNNLIINNQGSTGLIIGPGVIQGTLATFDTITANTFNATNISATLPFGIRIDGSFSRGIGINTDPLPNALTVNGIIQANGLSLPTTLQNPITFYNEESRTVVMSASNINNTNVPIKLRRINDVVFITIPSISVSSTNFTADSFHMLGALTSVNNTYRPAAFCEYPVIVSLNGNSQKGAISFNNSGDITIFNGTDPPSVFPGSPAFTNTGLPAEITLTYRFA
jgi:hypothetical protein